MMRNPGFTLVELIVVMALMGLIATVSVVALGSLRRPTQPPWLEEHQDARRAALRNGMTVSAVRENAAKLQPAILFLPDGRALGRGVDRWTGRITEDLPNAH
jgi:prepilin-type N-terminal cleavage/methylation domain-containing protein